MAMTEVLVYGSGVILTTIPSAVYMIRGNDNRSDDLASAFQALTLGLIWPITFLLLTPMGLGQGLVWLSRKLARIKH